MNSAPNEQHVNKVDTNSLSGMRVYREPHRVFLILGFIFGLIILVVTPPFQVADETRHFLRAFQISELHFLPEVMLNRDSLAQNTAASQSGAYLPSSLAKLIDSSQVAGVRFFPRNKVNVETMLAVSKDALNSNRREYLPTHYGSPIPYIPASIGIAVGRLFGLSPFYLLYLARLFTFLVWLYIVYRSIKKTPFLKWGFVLLSLMPMSLSLAASTSADALLIAFSLYLTAYLLELVFDTTNRSISVKDVAIVTTLSTLIVLCKIPYLVILCLFLFIPSARYKNVGYYLTSLAIIVVVSLSMFVAWQYVSTNAIPTGPNLYLERFGADAPILFTEVNKDAQMEYLKSSPPQFIIVLYHTAVRYYAYLGNSFIGRLGWLDTTLPKFLVFLYYAVFVVVCGFDGTSQRIGATKRLLLFFSFFAGLSMVALFLYLTWTPLHYNYIEGCMGRYIIPIALLPIIAISSRRLSKYSSRFYAIVIPLFIIISLSITAQTIVQRFYIFEPTAYQIEQLTVNQTKDTLLAKGWVVRHDTADFKTHYKVAIDDVLYEAQFGQPRPEIAQRQHVDAASSSEFEMKMPMASLKPGKHVMTVYYVDAQGKAAVIADGEPMKFNFDH